MIEKLCPTCKKGTISLGKCRRCGAAVLTAPGFGPDIRTEIFDVKGHGDLIDIGGTGERCPKCRNPISYRLRAVTEGAHTSSFHCISCQEIPCFVEGCEQRALISIPHTTGPSSGNPHWTPPTFRNDVCVCTDHHHALCLAQQKGLWYYVSRLAWFLMAPIGLRLIGSPVSPSKFIDIALAIAGFCLAIHGSVQEEKRNIKKKARFTSEYKVPTTRPHQPMTITDDEWPPMA